MAEKKRTDFEIERDRSEMAVLYTTGRKTHKQIAEILNERRQREYDEALAKFSRELRDGGGIPLIPPPYSLSRQQITEDLAQVRKQFVRLTSFSLDQMKGEQLAKIDELEARAWAALEASSQPTTKTTNVIAGVDTKGRPYRDEAGEVAPVLVKQTNQRTEQLADALWAKVILECVERRCALFGLDAPKDAGVLVNMPITLYGSDVDLEQL